MAGGELCVLESVCHYHREVPSIKWITLIWGGYQRDFSLRSTWPWGLCLANLPHPLGEILNFAQPILQSPRLARGPTPGASRWHVHNTSYGADVLTLVQWFFFRTYWKLWRRFNQLNILAGLSILRHFDLTFNSSPIHCITPFRSGPACNISRTNFFPMHVLRSYALRPSKQPWTIIGTLRPCLYGLGYPRQPFPSRQLCGAFIWSCEL